MIYILDTETTDSEPKTAEVIELAYLKFDSLSSILAGVIQGLPPATASKFFPSGEIKYGAIATHHIIPDELLGWPPSSTAELPSDCTYLIGHNIDFDWKMLGSEPSVRRICTLAMMRDLYPSLDSHKLSACMYFLGGQNRITRARLRDAHSATADIVFAAEILAHICAEKNITSIQDLYTYSEEARIPKILSFGKHKGEAVADVPYGYIKWYRGQEDTDPYLLEAFRRVTDAQYKGR